MKKAVIQAGCIRSKFFKMKYLIHNNMPPTVQYKVLLFRWETVLLKFMELQKHTHITPKTWLQQFAIIFKSYLQCSSTFQIMNFGWCKKYYFIKVTYTCIYFPHLQVSKLNKTKQILLLNRLIGSRSLAEQWINIM